MDKNNILILFQVSDKTQQILEVTSISCLKSL